MYIYMKQIKCDTFPTGELKLLANVANSAHLQWLLNVTFAASLKNMFELKDLFFF